MSYAENKDFEIQVEVNFSPPGVFTPTATDWYEFVENYVITYANRIKAEIDNDATITGAYDPEVLVLLNADIKRFEANAKFDKNLIVIHGIRSGTLESYGSGRNNRPIEATLTFYTRSDKGIVDNREVNLMGDGTVDRPGLYEIAEDVKTLLTENWLVQGGERYIWKISLGDVVPEDVLNAQLKGHVAKASMIVTGHKFEQTV